MEKTKLTHVALPVRLYERMMKALGALPYDTVREIIDDANETVQPAFMDKPKVDPLPDKQEL